MQQNATDRHIFITRSLEPEVSSKNLTVSDAIIDRPLIFNQIIDKQRSKLAKRLRKLA